MSMAARREAARRSPVKPAAVASALALVLVAAFALSFTLGRYDISLRLFLQVLAARIFGWTAAWAPTVETVIFSIRLPRILAAILIGAAMSLSGAAYQGMFKNPMASPDILGASAGAGFGAALAILLSFKPGGIQATAFAFGLGAVALTLGIGRLVSRGNDATLAVVLVGIAVSTLFQAFISIAKYVADPDSKLPAITFWLMGSLSTVSGKDVAPLAASVALGAAPLLLTRWRLNALSFGDEEASSLGVDVRSLRLTTIASSTLLTAACVSTCGLVGWVGLVIPHAARLIVGPDFKALMPASALIGAVFLLLADDVARCAFPIEIPLGVLTALIGAPFFLYLLPRRNRSWI